MKLSLVVACLDEIEIVNCFFRHYIPLVDEIVVCDGGSTDGTWPRIQNWVKETKRPITAFQHPQGDSLSDQINLGADRATGDWILYADMDEIFAGRTTRAMIEKALELPDRIWTLKILYYPVLDKNFTVRGVEREKVLAMRNRSDLRWKRKFHQLPTCPNENIKSNHSLIMLDYGRAKSLESLKRKWKNAEKFKDASAQYGIPISEEFYLRDLSESGVPLPVELRPDFSALGWNPR